MPRKNIKLPLHRGNDYPDEVRKMALDLLRRRRKRGLSMRDFFLQVAKVCDVRSPKTIEQWHRKYIQGRSDTPVRGRPVSLTAEEERVLMGEVIMRHVCNEDTTTADIIRVAERLLRKSISRHVVKRLGKKYGFSAVKAEGIKPVSLTDEKKAEGVAFLDKVRSLGIPPEKMFCLDKKGLHLGKIGGKHWRPIGWSVFARDSNYFLIFCFYRGTPKRRAAIHDKRDDLYTLLSAARGPVWFILVTEKQDILNNTIDRNTGSVIVLGKNRSKRKGKGTEAFEKVVHEIIHSGRVPSGSYIFSDNESSFLTKRANEDLKDARITHMTFPTYLGHLMNVCDNSFHAVFQQKFLQELRAFTDPTIVQKIQCAKKAYEQVSAASVTNMFLHCGLLGEEDTSKVIMALVHEGVRPAGPRFEQYRDLIDDALMWAGRTTNKMDIARQRCDVWATFWESFPSQK